MLTPVDSVGSCDFNSEAMAMISKHFHFFIPKSAAVLEIGTSEKTALGTEYSDMSRLAAMEGAFQGLESLTMASDKSLPFENESFDFVVVSSGIEGFVDPRDVFREVWRVLRPGGICMICFQSKPSSTISRPIKMWSTMTEEQKIWIAGRLCSLF